MDRATRVFWSAAAMLAGIAAVAVLERQTVPVQLRAPGAPASAVGTGELLADRRRVGGPSADREPAKVSAIDPRAASLPALRSAEQAWEARVEAYQRQAAIVRANAATPESADQAVRQLRASHFSADEQALLETYLTPPTPTLTRQ